METPNKTLRQHRALLGARQGDRQVPAIGTLFAHRHRLMDEMRESLIGQGMVHPRAAVASFDPLNSKAHSRALGDIANDLRLVDGEIAEIDERIEEIDRLLAVNERPGYL